MLKRIAVIAAYSALFTVSTVVFTYFSFPLERLAEFFEHKVNSSAKYRVYIDSVERDGLGRLVFSDVSLGLSRKLIKRPAIGPLPAPAPVPAASPDGKGDTPEEADKAATEGEDDDFSFVDIDTVAVDFSLLDLLNPAGTTVGISMDLLGGRITDGEVEFDRSVGYSKPAVRLQTIEDLSLGDTEFFAAIFSAILPSLKTDRVAGTLTRGSVVMEPALAEDEEAADEEAPAEGEEKTGDAKTGDEEKKEDAVPPAYYSGSIELELSDIVALSPILVQTAKGTHTEVPLTDMRLGNCKFGLKIDRKDRIEELDKVKTQNPAATVVLFEEGTCKGESLDYIIKGGSYILIPPKASLAKAQMELWTKLAFSPDYFEEKREEDGQVVTKNKELGQGLDFDPRWQKSQDVDGYYWMQCKGTLAKPRCQRKLPPAETARKKAAKELERSKAAAEKKAAAKEKGASAPKKTPRVAGPKKVIDARKKAEEKKRQEEIQRKIREAEARTVTPSPPSPSSGYPASPSRPEEPAAESPPEPDVTPQQPDVTPQQPDVVSQPQPDVQSGAQAGDVSHDTTPPPME
jgi:hypothetical protein